ncbi:hypothetical protein ACRAKG_36975 [Streptomyces rosealbus]
MPSGRTVTAARKDEVCTVPDERWWMPVIGVRTAGHVLKDVART